MQVWLPLPGAPGREGDKTKDCSQSGDHPGETHPGHTIQQTLKQENIVTGFASFIGLVTKIHSDKNTKEFNQSFD